MRTLILSCNTGGGHNSCARAIQEVYGFGGASCDVLDALSLISPKLSRFVAWGHIFFIGGFPGSFPSAMG